MTKDETSTLKVSFDQGAFALFDNWDQLRIYKPEYLTFHAPSEHTFDGKNYELEMQIYHKEQNSDNYAVVSIFFDSTLGGSDTNSFITEINPSVSSTKISSLSLKTLIDDIKSTSNFAESTYFYFGSFTIPPCTENVRWALINIP